MALEDPERRGFLRRFRRRSGGIEVSHAIALKKPTTDQWIIGGIIAKSAVSAMFMSFLPEAVLPPFRGMDTSMHHWLRSMGANEVLSTGGAHFATSFIIGSLIFLAYKRIREAFARRRPLRLAAARVMS